MVHHVLLPRIGVVAAEHDLARANLRDEVAEGLRREDQRVEIKLVQVFRRFFLQLDVGVAAGWRDEAGVVGPGRLGAQETTAMRRDDFQAREAIQRALEYHVLQGDGGAEGVADRVAQPAVAL